MALTAFDAAVSFDAAVAFDGSDLLAPVAPGESWRPDARLLWLRGRGVVLRWQPEERALAWDSGTRTLAWRPNDGKG